jgi:hypothetical protein
MIIYIVVLQSKKAMFKPEFLVQYYNTDPSPRSSDADPNPGSEIFHPGSKVKTIPDSESGSTSTI